jgi:hypothetical protein
VTAGRRVVVGPERLARWRDGYEQRHGPVTWAADPEGLTGEAPDGSRLRLLAPFPPSLPTGDDPVAALAADALAPRTVGVLLVRLGGHAMGVFRGDELVASKVGSPQVHGRAAAGGWSQQRFARRREGQVRVALQAAADVAARILLPHLPDLGAVVTGGERTAVASVLADTRLAGLWPLVVPRLLDVPDPRLRVLQATPEQFRAIDVRLWDAG